MQAVIVAMALAAVISSGLRARDQEMPSLGRTSRKICAAWAAEAGINVARASLDAGRGRWSGTLGHEHRRYSSSLEKRGTNLIIRAEGSCSGTGGTSSSLVELTLAPTKNGWRPAGRVESSRSRGEPSTRAR